MKKVSVIVPAYNAAKTLYTSINSILAQSYNNIEIVIINDGSTDGTANLCDEMAVTDTRIKIIHSANYGVSHARNLGLEAAEGEYICFVDSDDWVEQNFVSTLVDALECNETGLAMCGWLENDKYYQLEDERIVLDTESFLYSLFLCFGGHYFALWNKIFRREFLVKFDEKVSYLEDGIFICEYLKRIDKVSIIPDTLYHYVENSDSLTHSDRPTKERFSAFEGRQKMIKLMEEYPRIEKVAMTKYQETVRWILFTSYKAGYKEEIRPYVNELRCFRKEFYFLKDIPIKVKVRYAGYGLIVKFDLGVKVAIWWERLRSQD